MWKDVLGFEGHYQACETGEIRSVSRYVPHKVYGKMWVEGGLINQGKTAHGYLRVNLSLSGKPNYFQAHRVVAMVFIPNPENKPQVNHKNGVKTDNRVENLEWATNEENYCHAKSMGLIKSGDDLPYTILRGEYFEDIITRRSLGESIELISKDYGITRSTLGIFIKKQIAKRIADKRFIPNAKGLMVVK